MRYLQPLLIFLFLPGSYSCKKSESTSNTTQQKLTGKWNLISEVTVEHHNGNVDTSTFFWQPGDYFDFKTDGTIQDHQSGSSFIIPYGIVEEHKLWIGNTNDQYDIKTLTGTNLALYKKEETSPVDYTEVTKNLDK